MEHDEQIYVALVQQLDAGKGYTLQGHRVLDEPWIVREQYDRPVFFHPPGGIAFFWLMHRLAGDAGYAWAQLLSYTIFFVGLVIIGWTIIPALDSLAVLALAILAAFSPIMANVTGRFWLDGPLLAFSTAAAACFLLGLRRDRTGLAAVGALLLGFASLIKLTAFLIVPGVLALAVVTSHRERPGKLFRTSAYFVLIALACQLPWELWQWHLTGTAFPVWAGRPSPELVRNNLFVRYVTEMRSPWVYLELLPQVLWTIGPSLVLLAFHWRDRASRALGFGLMIWIAAVVGANVSLGALGYSKLLRYAILVTPATILLFTLVVDRCMKSFRSTPGTARFAMFVLLLLAGAGLALEVVQGLRTSLIDNASWDLIVPLAGLSGITR